MKINNRILKNFQEAGKDLFQSHLITSHSGNLSLKKEEYLIITRKRIMLSHITERDLVEVKINGYDINENNASTELETHRSIYRKTGAKAIIHAHPPVTVSISFLVEKIIPTDKEGSCLLKKVIVLPENGKESIPEILKKNKIVVMKGHGSFAIGNSLEEALNWTTSLEASTRIIFYRLVAESFNNL